ncbi:hypothetical protein R6Q59_018475 [Mikania micrantha]
MRKGSRNLWWLIPCTHTTRRELETESRLDVDVILGIELATIEEEPAETDVKNNRPAKSRKHVKIREQKINKEEIKKEKIKKEEMGRVFTAQYSLKNSYALFLERMTSSRSFGGLQLN